MGQGAQRFYISETNPNDGIGGGGCLCSEGRCEDRGGPYAVFHVTETDSMLSPHVVLCAPCARGVVDSIDGGVERLVAGEREVVAEETVAAPAVEGEPHENPVTEGHYPDLDALTDDDLVI